MVEPVPHLFEQLRRNYAGIDRVACENVAVADRDGRLQFYILAPGGDTDPEWAEAIGSFSRETLLRSAASIPNAEARIARIEVECLSFDSLCRRHGVEGLDLVLIDAEGYDSEVLRSIDFELHRPRVVVYEHFHLAPQQRAESRASLERLGYRAIEEAFDTWCLDVGVDDALTRAGERLEPAAPGFSIDEWNRWFGHDRDD
jgi:FkbM family methyltransferase